MLIVAGLRSDIEMALILPLFRRAINLVQQYQIDYLFVPKSHQIGFCCWLTGRMEQSFYF